MDKTNEPYQKSAPLTILELVHHYVVDIVGALIPGCVFLLGIGAFLKLNDNVLCMLVGQDNAQLLSSQIGIWIGSSQLCCALVFLMLAYATGLLFNRRSLQHPDAISQVLRSLTRAYKSPGIAAFVYFLICCLGSLRQFVSAFNCHIRKCCDDCTKYATTPDKREDLRKAFQNGEPSKKNYLGVDIAMRNNIVRGKIMISKCVMSFLLSEQKKYIYLSLGVLLMIVCAWGAEMVGKELVGAFTSHQPVTYPCCPALHVDPCCLEAKVLSDMCKEEASPDVWPYGVGIALIIITCIVACFEEFRSPFFDQRHEIRWRDCPLKKYYRGRNQEKAEAFNKCVFLKSQVNKYPYEDFFQVYLTVRDCSWLHSYGWNRERDAKGCPTVSRLRSNIRYIEAMKIRLQYIAPEKVASLRRIEAQIRLLASIWHMSKFFIQLCWGVLFALIVYKVFRDGYELLGAGTLKNGNVAGSDMPIFAQFGSDSSGVLECFLTIFMLFGAACFMAACFINYSIASASTYAKLCTCHTTLPR